MGECSPEKKQGCASMIYSGIFRRRSFWPRRSTSTGGIPSPSNSAGFRGSSPISKRRRGGSDEAAILTETDINELPIRQAEKPINKAPLNQPKAPPCNYQDQTRKPYNAMQRTAALTQGVGQGRKVPKEAISISGELDSMINDHQRSKGSSGLVRASSGNVMLYGNLGNLRQPGAGKSNAGNNILDYLPKTAHEVSSNPYGDSNTGSNAAKSNIAKKTNEKENRQKDKDTTSSLCRALSTRMDPEQLKMLGNEDFKEGRFAEALALYEAAIAIDPIFECREAIQIEPSYHRAHHRLATLYLRLGEAEKALYHYKQSGPEADTQDVSHAQGLQTHLNKCTESRRLRDWNTVLKETGSAISAGADSAPQIFALQAEAFLKLHRHQEADSTMSKGPKFSLEDCTKFFGPIGHASLLLVRAQVDMAAGRFEDAVEAAQKAARLDSNNRDVNLILRRTKGTASARSRGNDLFKASKFLDATTAYGEGLEHDPLNSVLLCNRAACRSKLGQIEKAVEDCTRALNVRPSYSKARLRRADCYAKLERWEASVQDYEVLIKETPEDEEVSKSLSEVKAKLRKQRSHDSSDIKSADNASTVSSKDHFRNVVESTGTSVVLFCNKLSNNEETQLIEQLSKRHRSVNFLKVDVDDNPNVAKAEGINSLPTFRIYKNGSRVKDISGTDHDLLEDSISNYCS
ncbi:hypothetical protein IFM89_039329 [Coptis chinensis]|uniref:Thioredoxin domain-containing protein n=1 Tax=Coptis chinensis TaxID=261450 RepID=A0A835HQL8_9MAGN|nr:hypothetical protein IFM89_039329 [Coptis chinensis]